jgi:hypothetical protein
VKFDSERNARLEKEKKAYRHWKMTDKEKRAYMRYLGNKLRSREILKIPIMLDDIADIIDPPRGKTNPGLNMQERLWQATYWVQCTVLLHIQMAAGKSYKDATKAIAKDEKISVASLRKNVPAEKVYKLAGVTTRGTKSRRASE